MRKISFIFATVVAVIFASCSGGGQESKQNDDSSQSSTEQLGDITINTGESVVSWTGEALGFYKHTGTVELLSADLKVENGMISGGNFTVDLGTIVPTDDNYNPEEGTTQEKLVGHLSSPDFFDVASYPTASFTISSIDGNTANGTLTVRGISLEEKVENISVMKEGDKVKISGDLVFNRKNYEVMWDYPMKDRVLSKDITVKVELVGVEG